MLFEGGATRNHELRGSIDRARIGIIISRASSLDPGPAASRKENEMVGGSPSTWIGLSRMRKNWGPYSHGQKLPPIVGTDT